MMAPYSGIRILSSQLKKTLVSVGPPLAKLSGSMHVLLDCLNFNVKKCIISAGDINSLSNLLVSSTPSVT